MQRIIIYILIGALLYLILSKVFKRQKYMKYFQKELGFGDVFLNNFSTDELITAYSYLRNYSRKGITLTPSVSPEFYFKVKALNDKAKSITGFPIFTNI